MKRQKTEGERQRRERSLWYSVLTVVLPLFAAALAALFVALCILYGRVRPTVTIELGEYSPDASAFVRAENDGAAYVTEPEERYRAAGDYRLRVRTGRLTVPVVLRVRDTQAPAAEGTETTVSTLQSPSPDKLIKNLRDQSIVKVSFETAPNYGTVGDYDATVLLEDASGNRTRVPVTVHVRVAADEIVLEAGDPAPDADTLLCDRYEDARIGEITEEMLREPGEYRIPITAGGVQTETRLVVKDTVPPTAKSVTYIAAPGETILPEMLIEDVIDETDVTAVFLSEPDPLSLSPQTIEVVLTDRGGNSTTVPSTLLFSNVQPTEIEARNTPLDVSELLEEGTYREASLSWAFVPSAPGMHVLSITIDGRENLALIDVKDTTPPEIGVLVKKAYLNKPKAAEDFANVRDVTEATLAFQTEPDWTKTSQDVTLVAVDTSGNVSKTTFALTLVPDVTPPAIYGVKDRYCYLDEPVSFLSEVSARDVCDGEVAVSVDASAVDTSRRGSYRVVYTATDLSGNTAKASAVFTVISAQVSEERAKEVADETLSKILTDDMTLAQQIEAIYEYLFYHIHYTPRSNKQDWRSEAVRGLTTGKGDCFTSYAAARLLLDQTEAQYVSIERDSSAHHYWLLVNIGTGWYHYDTCNEGAGKYHCFMWTNAQTRRISRRHWHFKESLYPQVATTPFEGGN
ncbi:MAG: hypothetical protein II117_01530 [Clostridia bacterium]|nr:hypothetical protein [Clostridia bacterium]